MAVLRLSNGSDISVKLSVEEAMSAINIVEGGPDFVELPGDEGRVHVRPAGVIAVLDDAPRGTAGFRLGQTAARE